MKSQKVISLSDDISGFCLFDKRTDLTWTLLISSYNSSSIRIDLLCSYVNGYLG
jgi:hypothetical protein